MEGTPIISFKAFQPISPRYSFEAKFYNKTRVYRIQPDYSETIETEDKWVKTDDSTENFQKIQIIMRKKYQIIGYFLENAEFFKIGYADSINVLFQDEEEHTGKILSIEVEKVESNTSIYKVIVEYIDENPNNYRDYKLPYINKLRSDFVIEEAVSIYMTEEEAIDSLVSINIITTKDIDLDFNTSTPYQFYTKLIPRTINEKIEDSTIVKEGLKLQTNYKSADIVVLRAYVTEDDAFVFNKYLPIADSVSIKSTEWLRTAIERVELEVKKITNGNNLYQVDIKMKYNNLNFSYYATT